MEQENDVCECKDACVYIDTVFSLLVIFTLCHFLSLIKIKGKGTEEKTVTKSFLKTTLEFHTASCLGIPVTITSRFIMVLVAFMILLMA